MARIVAGLGRLVLVAGAVAVVATAARASGNAAAGAAVFQRCAICHKVTKDGANGLGPNLFGIVGRKAASVAGFSYSAAMKNSGITWTDEKLEAYLAHPSAVVPGNRMAFAGIANPKQLEDLEAYLATLK